MRDLSLLISPRIFGLRNRLIRSTTKVRRKSLIMILMGFVFWGGMFVLSARVLIYFQSVDVIGDLLVHRLLSMILLTFFSLLIFSNIITALSNLYLSNDLELCHSTPASIEEVFLSRAFFTLTDSSWMVVIFGIPIMMAYAYVYRPDGEYYLHLFHMGLAVVILAANIGILITMILTNIFPAHRTRDIIVLLAMVLILTLYLLFRFLRPERLVDPDAFFSIMHYVGALEAPDSSYLPTHWMTETLWDYLKGSPSKSHFFQTALLWTSAMALLVINIWIAEVFYFRGFSRSQEAKRRIKGSNRILNLFKKLFARFTGDDLSSVMDKEVRTFFRDNTQWSQLLLLGGLIVVYLYNFSVLPLEKSPIRLEFLQNELAFLNMGLAGFVVSAVCARFIFPSISSEGEAFWIIRSSPLSMKRLLWGKYVFYLPPMLILIELLIIVTNYLLQVTPLMMILSSITMFLAVFGIVALAMAFGALYPNFRHENISQVASSFGGVMYMMVSVIFLAVIIILEAGPVYIVFMADHKGIPITMAQWFFIIPSFLAVLFVNVLAVFKPMKMALEALNRLE
ncbi:MAG: hypothetical protein V1930_00410 [Pseudomonadota bacterium]